MAPAAAETACAALLACVPEGFEELEVAGETRLVAYVESSRADRLRASFPDAKVEAVAAGWEDRWKDFHRPVRAGGLWIGPPWLAPERGERAVAVDPGRAFGTGAHATTRACIELLARLERGGLLDAGCGSGVVSVAAVRLGFAPVSAVDVDPVAVDVARETARMNGVALDARVADVLADELPEAELVVANIELGVVDALLGRSSARVAITSGYLARQTPTAQGWRRVDRLELEGWAADVLERS